jgi:ribosomal protein S18 acetylase RimI-like enzyme
VDIEGPSVSSAGLDELQPLWLALHRHHLTVARYRHLVQDVQHSWQERRRWYGELLADGGAYFVAREGDTAVGYAMTQATLGADDTFEVRGGIVEIVTLVVAESMRSRGAGRDLMAAVRDYAARIGIDTLKVAVMVGNQRAQAFYSKAGFEPAEEVWYVSL